MTAARCGLRRSLRIGTRGSRLALAQARLVAALLQGRHPDVDVQLVPVTTTGDRASAAWEGLGRARDPGASSVPAAAGAPSAPWAHPERAWWADPERAAQVGAFVKEIEQALLDGRCDLAVHSLKDVPTRLPDGLFLAAFPVREDPRDVLVLARPAASSDGAGARSQAGLPRSDPGFQAPPRVASGVAGSAGADPLPLIPQGARVGTASLRRLLQLVAVRPDVRGVAVRGNVDTRLARLDAGFADALVLAGAGLLRLGLASRITAWLDPRTVVPAPGQGALAVECRADDRWVAQMLSTIDDGRIRIAVAAERGFLQAVGAGCRWPVGALAALEPAGASGAPEPARAARLRLTGFVAVEAPGRDPGSPEGWMWRRGEVEEPVPEGEAQARELGARLARRLLGELQAARGRQPAGTGSEPGG